MKKELLKLTLCLPLALLAIQVSAQDASTQLPKLEQRHILVKQETTIQKETLSGINLSPANKGTFNLDFEQELKEDATLEITNTAGQLVFQKPVRASDTNDARRYNVGKLQPDTYLVEVKTSDTTYWSRFKVGK